MCETANCETHGSTTFFLNYGKVVICTMYRGSGVLYVCILSFMPDSNYCDLLKHCKTIISVSENCTL